MSRDEAIKELTELLPEEFLSEYTEAIKMGIEALKQQPIVVMGDMIPPKRHRAEWIKTYTYYNEGWGCSYCGNFSHIRFRTCPNCGCEMQEVEG